MKLSTIYRSLLAAAVFAAAGVAPALAVTTAGGETFAPYVAAFTPTFGPSGVPYAGTMQLLIHEGTVEGTYTGISVRPDRFDDRIVPVTGTVSTNDGYVQLFIGNSLSFKGTMDADGTISGTATYNGRLYDFMAKPGSLGHR
jgi:hypothetical protein